MTMQIDYQNDRVLSISPERLRLIEPSVVRWQIRRKPTGEGVFWLAKVYTHTLGRWSTHHIGMSEGEGKRAHDLLVEAGYVYRADDHAMEAVLRHPDVKISLPFD